MPDEPADCGVFPRHPTRGRVNVCGLNLGEKCCGAFRGMTRCAINVDARVARVFETRGGAASPISDDAAHKRCRLQRSVVNRTQQAESYDDQKDGADRLARCFRGFLRRIMGWGVQLP